MQIYLTADEILPSLFMKRLQSHIVAYGVVEYNINRVFSLLETLRDRIWGNDHFVDEIYESTYYQVKKLKNAW